ncbi:MAG TPA: hypothetical protein VL443_00555 [Cyclobacteriaceae bacterium]|jgi:hypothetical protein|nr:hypothetical protein [Cyclobacteriaceae bacterium]
MEKKIVSLTKEDSKLVMKGFALKYYKVFHLSFLIIFLLTLLYTLWKFNESNAYQSVIGFFIWLLLVFNFLFFIDYIFHKVQIIGARKIIFTGRVIDVIESGSEHGGTIVCFNHEKFDITWAKEIPEFTIGDILSIHFVNLRNGKRGSIIKVEKNVLH